MSWAADPVYDRLNRELKHARTAEIPSIPEIRECEQRKIRYITDCVIEYLREMCRVAPPRVRLRVIDGGACPEGPVRGICSPVKSRELKDFEALGRQIFGDIESCTTAWPAEEDPTACSPCCRSERSNEGL